MDLPTAWNLDDKSTYLSVDSSGLRVNYEGSGESGEAGAIRANNPIPPYCKLFYFEVDIIDEGKDKWIGIGFCEKEVDLNRMPGLDDDSWGYHGDDGKLFCSSGSGNPYGPLFSTGDTIGCCLNFKNNTVFYTKNGINLGIAFRNLKGTLYPCVGTWSQGGSIEVNFGSRKFKYAATTSNDMGDELLKNKLVEAFNMCINTTKIYTLEDLENSLKIKQDDALKFRGKFNFIMGSYEDAIIDLTKLLDIEPNSKFALRYRGEAYYLMEKYKESFNDVNKLLKIEGNEEWASKHFAKIIEKYPCVDETYELGYFYLHGINVVKDEYKAFDQFEKSANMGHTEGINCLGYCYEYGIGIEKNENKALTCYQKSADMYNSNAMYQVGYCYYLGIGVDINKHKAFTYYLKSAEAGNSMGIWKTAICYYYGIGVKKNNDKFREWIKKDPICRFFRLDLDITIGRSSKYGKCAHCNEDNTNPAWCHSCDPDIATRWTSRNKDIDDCMKTFILRTFAYKDAIEWIPFDRLSDVKKIGEGGFGSVFSAHWLDGIRQVEKINDGDSYIYKRTRKPFSTVALKTLAGSKEDKFDFLKEFKGLMECKLNYSGLAIYGITQNSETKEYMMVFPYANHGSLSKYLSNHFSELIWRDKLQILKDISFDLHRIHSYAGRIHADFHSGNILIDKQDCIRSYISDLGLSIKLNESVLEGNIYGVMPYVAPEVLSGLQQFTQAADIYGFGIVMAEMATGQKPFDGYNFDTNLANKICKGLRPGFGTGTPKCYIELAKKCMNSDPQKRPSAREIYWRIYDWLYELDSNYENEIKDQFIDADNVIKSLPISKNHDEMYTSKIISTKSN